MTFPRFLPLLALAVMACGDDPVSPDISGSYALVSVDGAALPATVSHDAIDQIVSGGLGLIANSPTCFLRVGVRAQVSGGDPIFGDLDPTCSYSRSRNTLTLTLVGDGFEDVTATLGTSAGQRTITGDFGVWGVMVFREVEQD